MKQAYYIINSKLLVTNINHHINKPLLFWIRKILWFFFVITIFICTGLIFYVILYSDNNLFNVISLGAVFATFGSTLVSIASLLCNRYYEEFNSCINIFKNELLTQEINFNWIFLKKQGVVRKSQNEYIIYHADNPKVVFEIGSVNLSIEIPVEKKDFYELALLKKIFKMKIAKQTYLVYLLNYADSIMESGLYIWECTYHILCSAFFYKIYRNFIITGVMFFISGLVAVFLYPVIMQGCF
ncbi:hypothetical protein C819_04049 [Lachnospiraceae bacterium 10-1]|nr:hypothetical protein C819_04049 [Lachnospiraceae bacterium 10-1]